MTKIPKNIMLEILWDVGVIEDVITAVSRWSVHHRIVFEHEGRFYQTKYSIGATESQDESPWQYQNEVECIEVHKVVKPVEVWEAV